MASAGTLRTIKLPAKALPAIGKGLNVLPTSNSAGPSTAAAADYLGSVGHLAAEETSDDAGQAYADRLKAVLALGPVSAPLDARTSRPSDLLQPKQGDGHACEGSPRQPKQEAAPGGPT